MEEEEGEEGGGSVGGQCSTAQLISPRNAADISPHPARSCTTPSSAPALACMAWHTGARWSSARTLTRGSSAERVSTGKRVEGTRERDEVACDGDRRGGHLR